VESINIRDLSIKCGRCGTYQTLCGFAKGDGVHVYTYECEDTGCEPTATRTLLEVPIELDMFAKRDPSWEG
jgi:hypothetical protein